MRKESPVNSRDLLITGGLPQTLEENIESWERERATLKEKIASIQARADGEKEPLKTRCDAYEKMIAGAQSLLPFMEMNGVAPIPRGPVESIETDSVKRRGRPPTLEPAKTWTATIEGIVKRCGRISYDELRAEISKTHLAKKLSKTDKSFYGAIGKLANQSSIIRRNGWLFSSAAHAKLMKDIAEGRAVDEKATSQNPGHQSPFGDAIKVFLGSRADGAASTDIIQELRKTPEFFDTIERHKSHAYNVLARLVAQGELVKGEGKYFRAPNKNMGEAQ